MKKIFLTSSLLIIIFSLSSQIPLSFNYQAIVRDANGFRLSSQNVNVKFSILLDSIGGASVYSETQPATSNPFGLINLLVGDGTVVSGDFTTIEWHKSEHFLKMEIDISGGNNFIEIETIQILSVPYSLQSKHVSSLTLTDSLGNRYDISVDTNGNIITTKEWICGDSLIDTRDNQKYKTVQIGTQCWMAENLNIGARIDGINNQTDNSVIEKYCYNDDTVNCDIYGGLYQWDEAMQYVLDTGAQGICPNGWHLPSDDEWKILEGTVDSQYGVGDPEWDGTGERGLDAGYHLKSTTGWIFNGNGTDQYGFTARPGGARYYYGGFIHLGNNAYFWSSTERNGFTAWGRRLHYSYDKVHRGNHGKAFGFSARCLQDCSPQPTQANAGSDQSNVQGTSTTLAANAPFYGLGNWALISSTSGSFSDTTNPASLFYGITGGAYILTWTISTHCGSSKDTVNINFAADSTFDCGDSLIDSRDGQAYATVQIGTQCWIKKNLNVGNMIPGNQDMANNDTIEKYCYNNAISNCVTYGGLYQWNEAIQYVTIEGVQGICPTGWHIPTDEEWKILEGTVDSQYGVGDPEWDGTGWRGLDAGYHLKSTTGWNSSGNGDNSFGFTALPGGYRLNGGGFSSLGYRAYFWSSAEYSGSDAWYRSLHYGIDRVNRSSYYKTYGFSARCLQD
ncbi:MAG: fibrobacter succinogenes major paralogous domain-containing protein [Bacteroidales bacterium]|nr:fibrobacter succinogenes major paralogous domain-containing protein [Bacteroidales bacterium]